MALLTRTDLRINRYCFVADFPFSDPVQMPIIRHRAKFRENRLNCSGDMADFRFFQDGGRPPSWICFTRVGTTHEEYLVVFVTVQNLVVIGALILTLCKF